MLEGVEIFIPTKKVRLKPNSAPWFGFRCFRAKEKKITAWKLWRRDPSDAAHRSYRLACADARRTYLESRRSYYHSVAAGLVRNPASAKEFWRAINSTMGRKKGRSIPTLVHEGVELSTSRAKAELLSRVFALKATIDDRGREPPTLPRVTHHDLHRIDFENCEVHRLLEGLKARKVTGPDGISARVLRDCANELTPSLSRLFRQSLSEGRVPSGWKHGRITACHKAGPKNNPEHLQTNLPAAHRLKSFGDHRQPTSSALFN